MSDVSRYEAAMRQFNAAVDLLKKGDHRGAVRLFRRVARIDAGALLEVAKAELLGLGCRRDVPGAIAKLWRVARSATVCQADQEEALLIMARMHLDGWLVRRSLARARHLYERAARIGSREAEGALAEIAGWEQERRLLGGRRRAGAKK